MMDRLSEETLYDIVMITKASRNQLWHLYRKHEVTSFRIDGFDGKSDNIGFISRKKSKVLPHLVRS